MRCDAEWGRGVVARRPCVTSRERKKPDGWSGQGRVRCRAGGGACGREAEPAQGSTQHRAEGQPTDVDVGYFALGGNCAGRPQMIPAREAPCDGFFGWRSRGEIRGSWVVVVGRGPGEAAAGRKVAMDGERGGVCVIAWLVGSRRAQSLPVTASLGRLARWVERAGPETG